MIKLKSSNERQNNIPRLGARYEKIHKKLKAEAIVAESMASFYLKTSLLPKSNNSAKCVV